MDKGPLDSSGNCYYVLEHFLEKGIYFEPMSHKILIAFKFLTFFFS